MVISQVLPRIDNSVHVCFHQVRDDVNVLIACLAGRLGDINKGNDVLMLEEFQKFDFTHNSLCINQILEGLWYFLDSNFGF